MTRDEHAAAELELEVLPDGLDGFQHQSVDRSRNPCRSPLLVGRRGSDSFADEGPKPHGDTANRVSLGHHAQHAW